MLFLFFQGERKKGAGEGRGEYTPTALNIEDNWLKDFFHLLVKKGC